MKTDQPSVTPEECVKFLRSFNGQESLYNIPEGCICQGDGLYGMRCNSNAHATLKPSVAIARAHLALLDSHEQTIQQLQADKERLKIAFHLIAEQAHTHMQSQCNCPLCRFIFEQQAIEAASAAIHDTKE